MLDEQRWIASQAIMKAIIEKPETKVENIALGFKSIMKIMEDYSTVNPQEEYINTGVRVPKAYWDATTWEAKCKIIMEGNRPQKTEKGWYVFSQQKYIDKFKKFMEETHGVE